MKNNEVNLNELKQMVQRFCEEREWDQFHNIKELAIGLVTESSELLEQFRFRSHDECEALITSSDSRIKFEDELADVFFFLLRIAGRYGVDLEKALEAKIEKNAAKYPVEKARGSNLKYDKL